ncbi:hypothetical protein DL98DRAFT_435621 [Cadophora sp. DSE1049]|nr:hypothetical protein DL98DRAFT_435621 [Cadophora sp. DSE1049]
MSGWVRIVTVTLTLPMSFDPNHYLPIYPTRKPQKSGLQLRLCWSLERQTILRLLSYVRIDKVEEAPLSEATKLDRLGVMSQEKSFSTLQNC